MDRRRLKDVRRLIVAVLVLALTACGSVKYGGVTTQPLTTPELKYRLIDTIGRPLFCGPPVVRMPSDAEAAQEVAALRSQDPATFDAIVRHEKLDAAHLTVDDDRRIVQQVQVLEALRLQEAQLFRFDYIAGRPSPEHVVGTIDAHGAISLESHDPTPFPGRGGCPICLAAGTRIATPNGEVPVAQLRPGMLVWTIDAGHRAAAPISAVGHTPAPFGHRVVRVILADGRAVTASPGHPTGDGRHVGDLNPGDLLDGSRVMTAELIPYVGDTWDLLPFSSTGQYWADGVLLGSTLALQKTYFVIV